MNSPYNVRDIFLSMQHDIENKRDSFLEKKQVVVRQLRTEKDAPFVLAIEPSLDKRMVMIPLIPPGTIDLKHFPPCHGVKLQRDRLKQVGSLIDQTYLVILQTNTETSIFEAFVFDLCERLWTCSEREAVAMVKKTLQKWQDFFRNADGSGLTAEQRRGLYGELKVLQMLLDQGLDPDVVGNWQGPLRKDVDFIFESVGVEVKTTLTQRPLKVAIASEDQLSAKETAELYLAVLALQVVSHGGETLCDVIEALRERMKDWPIERRLFEDLLFKYGYVDVHVVEYLKERFLLQETRYFKVEGNFPRIHPPTLLPGVVDVKYQIILDSFSEYERDESEVVHLIQEALADGS